MSVERLKKQWKITERISPKKTTKPNRAPAVEGRAMDRADILDAIVDICRNEVAGGQLDSTSVT